MSNFNYLPIRKLIYKNYKKGTNKSMDNNRYEEGLYDGAYLLKQFLDMPVHDKLLYFGSSSSEVVFKKFYLDQILNIMQEYIEDTQDEIYPGDIINDNGYIIYVTAISPYGLEDKDMYYGIQESGETVTGFVNSNIIVLGHDEEPAIALLQAFEYIVEDEEEEDEIDE